MSLRDRLRCLFSGRPVGRINRVSTSFASSTAATDVLPVGRFRFQIGFAHLPMANGSSNCWRDLALQHLSQLGSIIRDAESHVDLWQLLKERLSDNGIAEARTADTAAIYDYAWWCVTDSKTPDIVAEVEAYFYEDLPVHSDFEEQLPRFISPPQFEMLESSFKYRLSDDEYAVFRARYLDRQDGGCA